MYLQAKETARLYKLLSEKLGSDTAEAMFKYIDNRTKRSVEATIKTLATKGGIASIRAEIMDTREEITNLRYDIRKEIGEHKADTIKWMFIFWIGQIAAMLGTVFVFFKK